MTHSNPYSHEASKALVMNGWREIRSMGNRGCAAAFFALNKLTVLRMLGKAEGSLEKVVPQLEREVRPFISCSYKAGREHVAIEKSRLDIEDCKAILNEVLAQIAKQGKGFLKGPYKVLQTFLEREVKKAKEIVGYGKVAMKKAYLRQVGVEIPPDLGEHFSNMVCTAAEMPSSVALKEDEETLLSEVLEKGFNLPNFGGAGRAQQLLEAIVKQFRILRGKDRWDIFGMVMANSALASKKGRDGRLQPITHCAEPMAVEFIAKNTGKSCIIGIAYDLANSYGDYPSLFDPCENCREWVLEGGKLSNKVSTPITAMVVQRYYNYSDRERREGKVDFRLVSRSQLKRDEDGKLVQ